MEWPLSIFRAEEHRGRRRWFCNRVMKLHDVGLDCRGALGAIAIQITRRKTCKRG